MQTPQGSLKLGNLRLQLLSYGPVEIVGVDMAAVLHAVAESGVDQFNTELSHQQQDVVLYGQNTGGERNVEGYGAAVILRHISRNGISTNLGLDLTRPEIRSIGL